MRSFRMLVVVAAWGGSATWVSCAGQSSAVVEVDRTKPPAGGLPGGVR